VNAFQAERIIEFCNLILAVAPLARGDPSAVQ
jgi:hypothetical protein